MIQMKCIANHLLNYNLTERIKDINFLLDLTPLTRVDERGIRGGSAYVPILHTPHHWMSQRVQHCLPKLAPLPMFY